MTGALRVSLTTIAVDGSEMYSATVTTNDGSHARTFSTKFQRDAWLDAKAFGDSHSSPAVIAATAGQLDIVRAALTAGPEARNLVAVSDRRRYQGPRGLVPTLAELDRRDVA